VTAKMQRVPNCLAVTVTIFPKAASCWVVSVIAMLRQTIGEGRDLTDLLYQVEC
jgi:hypothetical protein